MKNKAKSLMLMGTGSDVGKSVLVAALCRALANRGFRVRPFKPQNMSNNAAVTADGGEIGRAQWLQAMAARAEPHVDMNPVLLKPQTDIGAQVVVHGRVFRSAAARDYQNLKPVLMPRVLESFHRLKQQADFVIVEGAGSPAEINLRQSDIANMGFALAANVPVILIGDIDRGGVIASLVGTHAVIEPEERAAIKGFLINKFRGDVSLFDGGLREIAARTGWPSLGVIPYLPVLAKLPAEDAVVLERKARADGVFRIAVPMLSRISNFDDLDPLKQEPGVAVQFVPPGKALPEDADLIVIPGTKATLGDLGFLRAQGWDIDILAHHRRGGAVLGICGGYQMMGRVVADPDGVEGDPGEAPGLGLLDVVTVMAKEKAVKRTVAQCPWLGESASGYEIHAGVTAGKGLENPFLTVDGAAIGARSTDGRAMGAYLHGLFAEGAFRKAFLQRLGGVASDGGDYLAALDSALDALAVDVERHADFAALLAAAG